MERGTETNVEKLWGGEKKETLAGNEPCEKRKWKVGQGLLRSRNRSKVPRKHWGEGWGVGDFSEQEMVEPRGGSAKKILNEKNARSRYLDKKRTRGVGVGVLLKAGGKMRLF